MTADGKKQIDPAAILEIATRLDISTDIERLRMLGRTFGMDYDTGARIPQTGEPIYTNDEARQLEASGKCLKALSSAAMDEFTGFPRRMFLEN